MAQQIMQVRRMKTDADRVRFAVRFATGKSPMALSERALKKLRDDVSTFLGFTGRRSKPPPAFGLHVTVLRAPWPWDCSKFALHEIHEETNRLLQNTVDGRGMDPTTISDGKDGQALGIDIVGPPEERTPRIAGSVRAAFLFTLWYLFASKAGDRVRACPECGRIFLRVRRQIYCSPKCTNRATWRNYPEQKKRRARQKYYDKYGWKLGARKKKGTRRGKKK